MIFKIEVNGAIIQVEINDEQLQREYQRDPQAANEMFFVHVSAAIDYLRVGSEVQKKLRQLESQTIDKRVRVAQDYARVDRAQEEAESYILERDYEDLN